MAIINVIFTFGANFSPQLFFSSVGKQFCRDLYSISIVLIQTHTPTICLWLQICDAVCSHGAALHYPRNKKILENSIFVIFHSGTAVPDRWYQSFDWLRASKFLATESFSLVHTYTLHLVPFKHPRRQPRLQRSALVSAKFPCVNFISKTP